MLDKTKNIVDKILYKGKYKQKEYSNISKDREYNRNCPNCGKRQFNGMFCNNCGYKSLN